MMIQIKWDNILMMSGQKKHGCKIVFCRGRQRNIISERFCRRAIYNINLRFKINLTSDATCIIIVTYLNKWKPFIKAVFIGSSSLGYKGINFFFLGLYRFYIYINVCLYHVRIIGLHTRELSQCDAFLDIGVVPIYLLLQLLRLQGNGSLFEFIPFLCHDI